MAADIAVRLNRTLVGALTRHVGRFRHAVGSKALGMDPEAIHSTHDHRGCSTDLGHSNGVCRLDVHDARSLQVDQVESSA